MDELEKLYNELMWFDKQKFLSKHLGDARPEDIDEYLEDGMDEKEAIKKVAKER